MCWVGGRGWWKDFCHPLKLVFTENCSEVPDGMVCCTEGFTDGDAFHGVEKDYGEHSLEECENLCKVSQ